MCQMAFVYASIPPRDLRTQRFVVRVDSGCGGPETYIIWGGSLKEKECSTMNFFKIRCWAARNPCRGDPEALALKTSEETHP